MRGQNLTVAPFVHPPNAGRAGLGIPNEAELIARLRARDLEALGELYRELGGRMTTLARTMRVMASVYGICPDTLTQASRLR